MKLIMSILLGILFILAVGGFVVLSAVRTHATTLSHYELERRSRQGDSRATALLRRQQLAADIEGVLQAKRLVLFAASFGLAVGAFGWGWAVLLTFLVILLQPVLSRTPIAVHSGRRLYDRYEPTLLYYLEKLPHVGVLLRGHHQASVKVQAGSKEELAHIIDQAGAHLNHEQQALLLHSLNFDQHVVSEVMTPKGEIDTIDRRELLGPLVLDDLHKTGHSFFPVTSGGIDHVIGVLSIGSFLSLDSKRSITAEKAMIPQVERIPETALLRDALKRFLKTHQHLLIVENGEGETVGVVTLNDIVAMLFGR